LVCNDFVVSRVVEKSGHGVPGFYFNDVMLHISINYHQEHTYPSGYKNVAGMDMRIDVQWINVTVMKCRWLALMGQLEDYNIMHRSGTIVK